MILRESTEPSELLCLAPGIDIADVGGDLLLSTDIAAVRLEGGVAGVVRGRLLPALTKPRPRHELLYEARDLPREEVNRLIDRLVSAGIVVETPNSASDTAGLWTHLVGTSFEARQAISRRAASASVVFIGLPTHQVQLIEILARAGLGSVLLVDAQPPYAGEARAMGAPQARSRQDLVREMLAPRWPMTRFVSAAATLTKQTAADLVADSQLVVVSVDRAMSATRHWINRATLDAGIPSIYADVRGHRAELGPLVLPDKGPCYMCWRMRAIACEEDFDSAMAWEEHFDAVRAPPGIGRPELPNLSPWIASVLGHEALAAILGIAQPRLSGAVLTIDGLELTQRVDHVIPHPNCPACRKKDASRYLPPPRLDELVLEPHRDTDLESIANVAVSTRCGIVRSLHRLPNDLDEPEMPVIVRADLANVVFSSDPTFTSCSGKGATLLAACAGALGEALERYAAMTWIPDRYVCAARGDLVGPSVDPRDLVLFAPEQYDELPYAPYNAHAPLEWVPARSLATGDDVWVPLLAVHPRYHPQEPAGYLFPTTSSGFAAQSTIAGALLHALLEVVERDAFLIAWAYRWAGRRSNALEVPDDETRAVAAAYARRGVRIDVHRLPTDTVPVVLAAAWSESRPAAVLGFGADLGQVAAARRAVLEVAQARPSLRARLCVPQTAHRLAELVADAGRVCDVTDHGLLYADPATAHTGLAHLIDAPFEKWDQPPDDAHPIGVALKKLVDMLLAVAGDAYYVDVTTDDVAALGVHVVRAIVPGFQPIHFGAREARLGGTRLLQAPALFGIGRAASGLHELNHFPHPLS